VKLLRQRIHKTVLVTVDTGETFRGALHAYDREVIVLRNAGQVEARSDSQFIPADGELLLPRGRVTLIQVP
jgi:small nuclear ribonucleoprotein (snRNP)-like protein